MRPITKSFIPAALNATGYNSAGLTGAGPFTSFLVSGPGDGLGHQITLTSAGANTNTLRITGTDVDGNVNTEVITGPSTSTVTSVNYYATLVSIAIVTGTIGTAITAGWNAVCNGPTVVLEWRSGAGAEVNAVVTGTINYSIQETAQPVYNTTPPAFGAAASTLTWTADTNFTGLTASKAAQLPVGMTAARLTIASLTGGATVGYSVTQPAGFMM